MGITVTDVLADRRVIHASGTVDAFQRAFTVDMHEFVTPLDVASLAAAVARDAR